MEISDRSPSWILGKEERETERKRKKGIRGEERIERKADEESGEKEVDAGEAWSGSRV